MPTFFFLFVHFVRIVQKLRPRLREWAAKVGIDYRISGMWGAIRMLVKIFLRLSWLGPLVASGFASHSALDSSIAVCLSSSCAGVWEIWCLTCQTLKKYAQPVAAKSD